MSNKAAFVNDLNFVSNEPTFGRICGQYSKCFRIRAPTFQKYLVLVYEVLRSNLYPDVLLI